MSFPSDPAGAEAQQREYARTARPEPEQEWTVGVVAETTTGRVVLKMTAQQADELRDRLVWVMDAELDRSGA